MSSLAATQADGYYVGAAYFDSGAYKKQSKNEWHRGRQQQPGQSRNETKNKLLNHPVVRFELPYSGRCTGCGAFIMRGTRYNAVKTKTTESYFTTPIYEFRFQCRACQQCEFVIRTDPKARGFAYVSGIERKKGSEDDGLVVAAEAEQTDPTKHFHHASRSFHAPKAPSSSLERLERQQMALRIAMTEREQLQLLQQVSHDKYEHDADQNARLRTLFRKDRHTRQRQRHLQQANQLGWRSGMALLDADVNDECQAKATVFGKKHHRERRDWQQVNRQSIFAPNKASDKRSISSGAYNKDDARPDGVVSASFERTRRSRKKDIATVDLTTDSGYDLGKSDCLPRKRTKLTMAAAAGVITLPKPDTIAPEGSLASLMDGYGSSDSDCTQNACRN